VYICETVFNFVGFLINPADKEIALLPNLLKKTLAPHFLQNPLLAFVEETNHLSVFLDVYVIFSSKTEV